MDPVTLPAWLTWDPYFIALIKSNYLVLSTIAGLIVAYIKITPSKKDDKALTAITQEVSKRIGGVIHGNKENQS